MPAFGSRQEGPQYPFTTHSIPLIFISFETKLCHGFMDSRMKQDLFLLWVKGKQVETRMVWYGPRLRIAQMETVELAREHSSHYSLTPHPWPLMA